MVDPAKLTTQDPSQMGGVQGVNNLQDNPSPSGTPFGDNAVMKALYMQIIELSFLSNAAMSESGLSVAIRSQMQGNVNDHLTELNELLNLATTCQGADWSKLSSWMKGSSHNFSALMKQFPNSGLSGVPSSCRSDFAERLYNLANIKDTGHVSEFRANVASLSSVINNLSTVQTACKNLADGAQTAASNLTQAITQFLAQISAEAGLITDASAN